jgi:hypothetical protein
MIQRESFNPILNGSPLPLFEFGKAGLHRTGHTSLVYLPDIAASDPAEASIDRQPAFGKRFKRHYWRYEIDVAHHSTWVTLVLPAAEEAFSFTAKVCFTWTVADAAVVARFGIYDAKAIIWRYLDQLLRNISRQYRIEDSGAAEEEMNRRLEKESGDIDYGLRLSLMAVNLHLDQDAQQHLANRVGSRRATELARDEHGLQILREQDKHGLQVLREKHTAEQARLRGDLERAQAQHMRDLEIASAKHSRDLESIAAEHARELESLTAEHARDMELVRTKHSLDLDSVNAEHTRTVESVTNRHNLELKEQRVRFYRDALKGNGYDFVVLQLIEHPGDITAVVDMMQAGKDTYYERTRAVMKDLLDREMVNPADIEPLREHAINQLRAALNLAAPPIGVTIEHDERTTVAEKTAERVVVAEKSESTRLSAG